MLMHGAVLMDMRLRGRLGVLGLLEDFGLEDQGNGGQLLGHGHAEARNQAGHRRDQDDVAEIRHVALP